MQADADSSLAMSGAHFRDSPVPQQRRRISNTSAFPPRYVTFARQIASISDVPAAVPTEEPPVYVTLCDFLKRKHKSDEEDQLVALDPSVFNHPLRRDILYLCVNFYRDALRQGSANTKTRGEVAGSGRKIRPQKGSGRARLGDAQSPMLRGGGVAFGPKPRDFSTRLPRKVRQMGMRVALSAKLRENELGITRSLDWTGTKTNEFAKHLQSLGWGRTLLVAGGQVPLQLERVCRNLEDVEVVTAEDLHIYAMLKWPRLLLDVAAVEYFERLLSKNIPEDQRIAMPSPPALRNSRSLAGRLGKRSPSIPEVDVREDSAVLYE